MHRLKSFIVCRPRHVLLGLLFVVLLVPGMAQDNFLSLYSASTNDGAMSMFLPVDWVMLDGRPTVNAVAFGMFEEYAQERIDKLGLPLGEQLTVGPSGSIEFFTREDFDLSADATAIDLLPVIEARVKEFEDIGYTRTIEPKATLTRYGQGVYSVVENSQEAAYISYILYGDTVTYGRIGASLENFQQYSGEFVASVNSVRIPGETLPDPLELTQIASSDSGQFSMHLPAGWSYGTTKSLFLDEVLTFANSSSNFEDTYREFSKFDFYRLTWPGIGGFVGFVSAESLENIDTTAQAEYDDYLRVLTFTPSAREQRPWTIPGVEGEGVLSYTYRRPSITIDEVYVGSIEGMMMLNGGLLKMGIWVNPSQDWRRSMALMENIAASLALPAEEEALTAPAKEATPIVSDPDEDGFVTRVSTGHLVSIDLPETWFVQDQLDSKTDALTFSSTEQGAIDRLTASGGEGLGGHLKLFVYNVNTLPPYPSIGQDKKYLNAWFEETGAVVIKEPEVVDVKGKRIIYAVYQLDEREWGYAVLYDFGSSFSFGTFTAPTKEEFDENSGFLAHIAESLTLPAKMP